MRKLKLICEKIDLFDVGLIAFLAFMITVFIIGTYCEGHFIGEKVVISGDTLTVIAVNSSGNFILSNGIEADAAVIRKNLMQCSGK